QEKQSQGEGAEDRSLEELSREELVEVVRVLTEKAEKNFELYLRTQAEMENMKRRHQREKEEWRRFATEKLIKEILPAVDNLEKAVGHSKESDSRESLKEGVELTLKGLKEALERVGLSEIKAEGEHFDPNYHEAISMQEHPEKESGKVLQELQKGYTLNERLIRPAMVVVCSGGPDQGGGDQCPDNESSENKENI
ncbi:MAG: nucleotide exchange factor GrpE, partial [Desulfobacteraceae bacterium]